MVSANYEGLSAFCVQGEHITSRVRDRLHDTSLN